MAEIIKTQTVSQKVLARMQNFGKQWKDASPAGGGDWPPDGSHLVLARAFNIREGIAKVGQARFPAILATFDWQLLEDPDPSRAEGRKWKGRTFRFLDDESYSKVPEDMRFGFDMDRDAYAAFVQAILGTYDLPPAQSLTEIVQAIQNSPEPGLIMRIEVSSNTSKKDNKVYRREAALERIPPEMFNAPDVGAVEEVSA